MRQLFSRLLVVGLLLVACSGAAWGDNLTVTFTKSDGTQNTKTGQESLAMAFEGYELGEIEGIEVIAGKFETADWYWLRNNRKDLKNLKKFVVTDGIESMADIPNTFESSRHFSGALKELHIAKLKRVGDYAFNVWTGLTSVSLPVVTEIGEGAFSGCAGLTSLELGATPPSVKLNAFPGCPLVRKLKLVDAGGSPLTGDALANAIARYRAVEDGDTEDNLWYGWAFEEFPAGNLSGTIDGVAFTNAASLEAAMQGKTLGNVKELTITGGTFQIPDWAYLLEQGQDKLKIEQFTIENGVERVADMPDLPYESARYFPKVQQVNIAKMRKVGYRAFRGCTGLTSVSLPAATEIGASAFSGCTGLTSVSLPAATEIGASAFSGCTGLTSVSLPAATKIVGSAFRGCTGLTSVSLPAATKIGEGAFESCENLTSVSLPEATVVGNSAFSGCEALTNVSLPAATKIDEYAFWRCTGLTSVSLPVATEIGGYAFYYCEGLTSVSLPAATKIDDNAFESCENLTSVSLPGATVIGKCAFIDCKALTSVSLPVAIVIGEDAFSGCEALTSVSLPVATEIGGYAFIGCTGLTSVSLPVATEIGKVAFSGCTNLTSVSLPAATKIGEKAFMGRERFTSLQLGATPPNVGRGAFLGCPLVRKLKLLDADGTPLTGDALTNAISRYIAVEDGDTEDNLWYGWAFEDVPASNLSGAIDGVAFSGAASLEVAMQGKDFSKVKEIAITGGRFQLSDWDFLLKEGQYELAIEKFTIESSVDRVVSMPDLPDDSPWYLPKAQKVNIAKIRGIGANAFAGCTGLTSVSLPAATKIGYSAFYGCTGLTSVSLPAATKIDRSAFEGCTGLTSVSLPAAIEIDDWAFSDCTSLTSVSLPAAIEIDDWAFSDCTSLTSVSLPGATVIGECAFLKCKKLKSVSLPAATEIGENAFNNCTSLTSVSLPAASYIRFEAFANCSSLKTIKLGATPPSDIDAPTFENCPNERTLIITDAMGVPLVGTELKAAADNYDGKEGDPHDGKWYGWTIEKNPPAMLSVIVEPAGAGTAKITRKDGGAVVNEGDKLTKDEVLVIDAKPNDEHQYKLKEVTAKGANSNGGNEWKVTANPGEQVVFTVEFEKLATLGATNIKPAGAGKVTIKRKDDGIVVKPGVSLKEGAVLVVEGKPENGYRVKAITAEGAKKIGDKEWEVTAMTGQVIFTVEFEKKPEGESNNPTPVESALLAQAQLSPNPTDGQVTIEAGTTLARCEVYSSTGALLQAIESPKRVFTIDLTASPSGVYLVRLVDVNGESKTLRAVKQ